MAEDNKTVTVAPVPLREVAAELLTTRALAQSTFDELQGYEWLQTVDLLTVPAEAVLSNPGDPTRYYWLILSGEVRGDRVDPDGSRTTLGHDTTGGGFGEVPLLSGMSKMPLLIVANQDSRLVRLTADQFWKLMASCPSIRETVLSEASQRQLNYQVHTLHQQKLASLGTLAAGLMHELHNPGAAAKRSASQLRENLLLLQQLSLRNSSRPKTPEQLECMRGLLQHALQECRLTALSSLEQADAEEAMAQWLSASGVENAYTIAPTLVAMGFDQQELSCARSFFDVAAFSDALNWLGALVSSVSLVCAIEESISRVSDLVMAVKKFAYDERSPARDLDVHDSLQSTLTILGHKLRSRQITVKKEFAAKPSTIFTRGYALSQVWTNLIDNAADASPQEGQIEIDTWTEQDESPGWLAVGITDHGSGIPADVLPHIFDVFFTTKPQGSGTGLGLDIVHRIVTQKFHGRIDVESEPGKTRFVVRLPLTSSAESETPPA